MELIIFQKDIFELFYKNQNLVCKLPQLINIINTSEDKKLVTYIQTKLEHFRSIGAIR